MSSWTAFVAGFLASLLANYLLLPFRRVTESMFGWLFHLLNPDRFDLTGKWLQKFSEPTEEDPSKWQETQETVRLRQLGNRISGRGETHDDHRQFQYDFRVQHNLVFGSYKKIGEKGNIAGNGVIQMIVSPDCLGMKGQTTWFDHDTNQIESSGCLWTKLS
jgi:hypothetical protein